MAQNPLTQIAQYGQSVWYDNVSRDLYRSGELQRLIDEDGVVGQTSNPNFFKEAIVGRETYDDQMRELVAAGKNTDEVYEVLTTTDIRACCDVFAPLFERTNGADGYVSIEVSPALAHDTERTIAEARTLWKIVDRPNVMVKIPAAPESIPAIKQALFEGINVNVTLIFSIESYREVMEAYISALEARTATGKPIDHIASVGSFFVSRVDVMIDKMLEDKIKAGGDEARLRPLLGKAAIANAKEAYHVFRETFSGPRWEALAAKGAKVQRPLWASTGAKNPAYRDVLYAEELIGPDTVDTMGPPTITAMRDHGIVRGNTVEEDYASVSHALSELEAVGIDMAKVTQDLQDAGIKQFADSFEAVVGDVGKKVEQFKAAAGKESQAAFLADGQSAVDATLTRFATENWGGRIWDFDPTVWKSDAATGKKIVNRLGWLPVVAEMQADAPNLRAFADEVRAAGFTHAVLCGMGGSSLAPEVFRTTYGVASGYLDLAVLDTTDPATVRSLDERSDPAKTLFVISTKSGGTTETMSFFRHMWERVKAVKGGDKAGENFVAITDPGSSLESLAKEDNFRRTFLNRADIGGRYSSLSYFGLVPAALIGADIGKLLASAAEMAKRCGPDVAAKENPGLALGTAMGELGLAGRDKVTFIPSAPVATYGYWVEQLIAESTGKEGKGLVPVEGEPVGAPVAYGDDRFFAYLRLAGDTSQDAAVERLKAAGHPVVTYDLRDPYDLGGQMFLWEFATAVTGGVMGIDPFDEPNVQESKDNTSRLLKEYEATGKLPDPAAAITSGSLGIAGEGVSGSGAEDVLAAFFDTLQPGDYFDIAAYVPRTPASVNAFLVIRTAVRDAKRAATTVGFGPRFLHSTGQLHKGGPNTGIFLQVVLANEARDEEIPGSPYSFGVLKAAQALGDLQSLQEHGRRAIRVTLHGDMDTALRELTAAATAAVQQPAVAD